MNSTNNKDKWLPLILHICSWTLLIILPQLIIIKYWGSNAYFARGFYLNVAVYGIIFYINFLLLVPYLYLKGKKLMYFGSATIVIFLLYYITTYVSQHVINDPEIEKIIGEAYKKLIDEYSVLRPPSQQIQAYYFILILTIVTGFSVGLRVIERHAASEKRQKELEKEKLNSELAFLKNQVSPHFFFNTLNNIYSLIEINSNDAQEAVLKLSKLMRYLLYESEHGETLLSHEVDFMRHYIDLMKLRLSNKIKLDINLPDNNPQYKIPPLLFIPFIENAFKHGISYRENSFVNISMQTENREINFLCVNSLGQRKDAENRENHSGIGLENVKKRLNLLFPKKHLLEIKQSDNTFKVALKIDLNQ